MSVLNGSQSFTRFLVDGDVAAAGAIEKAVEARRFLPLSPTGEVSQSAGWVPLEAPFDDELAITRDVLVFGDLIAIAYREDTYRIPRALLVRETKKRLDKIAVDEKKPRDEMGRAFIKAVEQSVLVELKGKTIPRAKIVDVLWDTTRGEVRVYAMGAIATERVASIFERTFQVRIEVASYAARAFTVDLDSRAAAVLDRLMPSPLFVDDADMKEVADAAA